VYTKAAVFSLNCKRPRNFSASLVYVQNDDTLFDQRNQAIWTLSLEKPDFGFDSFRQFRAGSLLTLLLEAIFDFTSVFRREGFVSKNIFSYL
jgi:hypothetical protein